MFHHIKRKAIMKRHINLIQTIYKVLNIDRTREVERNFWINIMNLLAQRVSIISNLLHAIKNLLIKNISHQNLILNQTNRQAQ